MGGYGDVQLLRDDGLRLDGRKVDEMREVKVEAWSSSGCRWFCLGKARTECSSLCSIWANGSPSS